MRGSWRIKQVLARRRRARLSRDAVRAVGNFPAVAARRPHNLPDGLTVTLTSYPPRYPTLAATIKSLLDQDIAPDRTVLWIDHADVDTLPDDVRALTSHGLEIGECEDLRSYKKLLPALVEAPHTILVTADDDIYYPPCWLKGLVETHGADPDRVVAWRAHVARTTTDGRPARYADWELATSRTQVDEPRAALFPTGVGGVLYPPGSLHADVLKRERFMSLCPRGDDIWFYWMARRAGTRHARVDGWLELIDWPGSQHVGLSVRNLEGDGNDLQIFAMEKAYGPFPF